MSDCIRPSDADRSLAQLEELLLCRHVQGATGQELPRQELPVWPSCHGHGFLLSKEVDIAVRFI